MTLDLFLTFLTQITFVLVAAVTLADWIWNRDRTRLDIALVFISLSASIVIQSVQRVVGVQAPWLGTVGSLAVMAQPYLLLRIAQYFRPVRPLIQRGALAGLALSWAALIILSGQTPPTLITILIIVYFVIVEVYATTILFQGALTVAGITRQRLRLASAGSGLLAAIILFAGLLVVMPAALRPVVASLFQVLAILSGLSYYFGFAPPGWLRRAWQLAELHRFLRQTSERFTNDSAVTFKQLSAAALRTVGGTVAVIARWDAADQHLKIEIPGQPPLQAENLETESGAIGRAWRERQARVARVPSDIGPVIIGWAEQAGAKSLLIIPIVSSLRPWGLLIIALRYAPLFGQDDLDLLALLAEQSAIALDHTALIEELRVANQSLEQRVAERTAELSKTNRALRTISDCNQILVRVESEAELLDQICHSIVETGGYRMAWVGFAEYDAERRVRPAAWTGANDGFLESINLTWDDTDRGRIPMGIAIRTGRPQTFHIATDHAYEPWRDQALRRGYAACIALPLIAGDRVFGGLGIFAAEQDAFDAAEVKLLGELANDLAYGITALRTRAAHARAEEALQASERRFRALVETSGMLINLINSEGVLIYVSPSSAQVIGHTPEEMVGRPAIEFLHPDEIEDKQRPFSRMFRQPGITLKVERRVLHKDGSWRWVEGYSTNLIDDPAVGALVFNYRDITDRKRVEKALYESEEHYRSLFENMLNGFAACRMIFENGQPIDFVYLDVNNAFETLTGLKNVVGKKVSEVIPGIHESNPELLEIYGRVAMTGKPDRFETHLPALGIWFSISVYSPQQDQFVAIFDNITDRKRAEEKLRESQSQLTAIIGSAMDAIITVDAEQRILLFNAAAERMFQCSTADVLGGPLDRLIPERLRSIHTQHIRQFGETGVTNRVMGKLDALSAVRADGEEFPIEASISQTRLHGQQFYTVILRDITERKQVEEALREREEFHRRLFENMRETLVIQEVVADDTGKPVDLMFLDINPAAERVLGKMRSELVGRTRSEISGQPDREGVEMASRVASTGQPFRMVRYSPGFGSWFESVTYSLGSRIVASLALDITERKQAEDRLHDTLIKLERNNRELQDFAYVASHDLQEPLRKIQAFGDRLVATSGDRLDEKGRDYLGRMHSAAGRMQTLINDLLAFSRITTKAQPFAPVNLNQVMRAVLSDLEVRIEQSGGRVEAAPLPVIEADATQMRQVFQNLISNALKFHKPNALPMVKVYADQVDAPANPLVSIVVEDNGIGFDEKYLDRIFSPFQRLHGRNEYEGTGIGLAVVRKIVERHGGSVTATSHEGAGAKFIVTLPIKH